MRLVISSHTIRQETVVTCLEGKEIINRFKIPGKQVGNVQVQSFQFNNVNRMVVVDLNMAEVKKAQD